jgi:hypothetical protein
MIVQGKNAKYRIRLADIDDLPALPTIEQAAGQQFVELGLAYLENITLPMEILIKVLVQKQLRASTAVLRLIPVLKCEVINEQVQSPTGWSRMGYHYDVWRNRWFCPCIGGQGVPSS